MKKLLTPFIALLLISAECNPEDFTVYSISASPSALTFASMPVGYITQPSAQTVTITNTGMGAITLDPLPLPPTGYTFTALSTLNLDPGGTATFSIRPNAGLGVGTYHDTFKVTGSNGVSVTISPLFNVTTLPVPFLSGGTVDRADEENATIGFTTTMAGDAYSLVLTYGATAPTSAEVKAGLSLGAVPSGGFFGKPVSSTTHGPWDIYVVVETTAGALSAPLRIPAPFIGAGTEISPYLIDSRQKLEIMRDLVNQGLGAYPTAHYKQTDNIDLANISNWTPIGTYNIFHFMGVYDGDGKVISQLKITENKADFGLFGCLTSGAVVKNVRLNGVNIQGTTFLGGVVGRLISGTVEYCRVIGFSGNSISGTGTYVGGIAGLVGTEGVVQNCYVSGDFPISASGGYGGGVAGGNEGTVQNCYTNAVIGGRYVGGIVGENVGNVTYCYAMRTVGVWVAGSTVSGGVVSSNSSTLRNCIAINSSIEAWNYIGRVVGENVGVLNSNYACSDIGMELKLGGDATYTPIPGVNLKDGADVILASLENEMWYTTTGNWTGGVWDFDNVWTMGNSLPILQGFPGDSQ